MKTLLKGILVVIAGAIIYLAGYTRGNNVAATQIQWTTQEQLKQFDQAIQTLENTKNIIVAKRTTLEGMYQRIRDQDAELDSLHNLVDNGPFPQR